MILIIITTIILVTRDRILKPKPNCGKMHYVCLLTYCYIDYLRRL